MSRWIPVVQAVFLCALAAPAQAAEAPAAAPVRLYVVAPDGGCTWETNVLPAEATLRAVAIEAAAAGADVVFVPVDQRATLADSAYPRVTASLVEGKEHTWAFSLEHAAGKAVPIGEEKFEWGTFDALSRCVGRAAEGVTLLMRAAVSLPPAPRASQLSVADEQALGKAFDRITDLGPGVAIAEAAKIDAVLTANPRSPDALCAAAWPACILGTGELYGSFQLRNRWLAVPLSWWVEARVCGAEGSARGQTHDRVGGASVRIP